MIRTPQDLRDARQRWYAMTGSYSAFDYVAGVLAVATCASDIMAAMQNGVAPTAFVLRSLHNSPIVEWELEAQGKILLRYRLRERPPHPADITIIPLA